MREGRRPGYFGGGCKRLKVRVASSRSARFHVSRPPRAHPAVRGVLPRGHREVVGQEATLDAEAVAGAAGDGEALHERTASAASSAAAVGRVQNAQDPTKGADWRRCRSYRADHNAKSRRVGKFPTSRRRSARVERPFTSQHSEPQ